MTKIPLLQSLQVTTHLLFHQSFQYRWNLQAVQLLLNFRSQKYSLNFYKTSSNQATSNMTYSLLWHQLALWIRKQPINLLIIFSQTSKRESNLWYVLITLLTHSNLMIYMFCMEVYQKMRSSQINLYQPSKKLLGRRVLMLK